MRLKEKRRTLDVGFDGEPPGVNLAPNQIDGLLGRDRQGVWFLAGLPTEVAPGIEETLLDVGWYPGMPPGQEIVILEDDGTGRRAYVVHHGHEVSYRCMRRTWRGFCNQRTCGPCGLHRQLGDTVTAGPKLITRLDIRKVEMPAGWTLVGVIPGTCNTFFARNDLTGDIRPVCMRRRSLAGIVRSAEEGKSTHPRCMGAPLRKHGKPYGPCYRHRWAGKKELVFKNKMDPNFKSLLYRSVQSHPAVDQIRNRLDTISYSWYLFLDACAKRQKLLDEGEERATGLDAVIAAAKNVAAATSLQSEQQADVFRDTGRVWAQQAYSLRLAQALAEACHEEPDAVVDRVGKKMHKAMTRRGIIAKNRDMPAVTPGRDEVSVTEDMQIEVEGIRARHSKELEMLGALQTVGRAQDYMAVVDVMEDKILSLYPLINTVYDLLILEEAAEAPITTVRNRLNATMLGVMKIQNAMEKRLDLRLTQRQIDEITSSTIDAVMEAIADERPQTQRDILERFDKLKDDVKMPTRADEAVGVVMEAVKARVKERYR